MARAARPAAAALPAGGAATPGLAQWRRTRTSTVDLYFSFVRLAFLKYLAYRLRYYTGVLSYTIFIAGNFYLYRAIYQSRPEADAQVGGLTLLEMVTYVSLSWIGRSFYFNNIDRTLAGQIRRGEIATMLIKPLHVQTMMLFEAVGEAGFRLLLFTFPILAVVLPLFRIQPAPDPSLYGWTLLSFALAFVVNAQINFLVGCLAFFFKNINGIIRAKMVTMEFLTGVLIPFTFFPLWFQKAVAWLPFQAVSYVPVTIYLGRRTGEDLLSALLIQAAWAVGLLLAGRLLWSWSVRHVTLQGG